MKRYLLALTLTASLAPAAHAAPLCSGNGAFWQGDTSGVYVSPEHAMRVEIFPCGGTYVQWDNAYGTHATAHTSTNRLTGGGVAASGMANAAPYLDGLYRIGFKPAKKGYIQVFTLGAYDESFRVYRLRKIA